MTKAPATSAVMIAAAGATPKAPSTPVTTGGITKPARLSSPETTPSTVPRRSSGETSDASAGKAALTTLIPIPNSSSKTAASANVVANGTSAKATAHKPSPRFVARRLPIVSTSRPITVTCSVTWRMPNDANTYDVCATSQPSCWCKISVIDANQPYMPSVYTSRSRSTGATALSASDVKMSRSPTGLAASAGARPRDSGNITIVSTSVTTCSAAATRNGTAKPAANAGPTYANASPRRFGSTRSATYACVTPMLPPERPSSARENSTHGIDGANASSVHAIVEPICDTISTILRPMRSLTLPHTGPAMSWHSEYVANTTPTVMSGAPNFMTKNGMSGIRMLNPRMSMKVMPRIGSSRRIKSAR